MSPQVETQDFDGSPEKRMITSYGIFKTPKSKRGAKVRMQKN